MLLIIANIVAAWLIISCSGNDIPTINVDTSLGSIQGIQMETRLGAKFWSFRGIRYAEPPVGELRFQNPQSVKEWKPKVFDATRDGPICPQALVNSSELSEDCLRLNVYTNNIKGNSSGCGNNLKPVIVYLHPGGFYSVSAVSYFAGPQNFMDRDIVLVTLNYRLGSLGFLATGTADAPGNMGLKDQVMALRWIQQHINQFGGNPKEVTLWGYSAGSVSIGLHMMSPMSKGLFHRAIMQSASPLAQFRYRNNQTELAEKQSRLLDCPVKNIKEMIGCLKTKSMMDFVNTTTAMFEFEWNPVFNWMPVVEKYNDGVGERFLVEDPYMTMLSGDIHKVPLIMGITQYEFYYLAYYTLRNETQRERFNRDFAKHNPIYFLYERDTPKSHNISQALRSFYFQNEDLKFPESLIPFGELYSDGLICFEYYRFLQMVSKHVPVYTYLFSYKGRYSHFVDPDTNKTYGAMHHDELLYLFNVPILTPMFSKTDPENETIERLTQMWYEFAKKGDPNNRNDKNLKNLNWPLYDATTKSYLEIGDDLNVKLHGIFPKRLELWDRLFPIEDMLSQNL